MPATTAKGLPYPLTSDPDNVPGDMLSLATFLNNYFPAGPIVGTTDTQTLTNKTIANPSTGVTPLPINAITGTTADLLFAQVNSGTKLFSVTAAGRTQVTDNGVGADTATYARLGVTTATDGASYIGLTRSGTSAWGIGITGTDLIFGNPNTSAQIPTPLARLTSAGFLTTASGITAAGQVTGTALSAGTGLISGGALNVSGASHFMQGTNSGQVTLDVRMAGGQSVDGFRLTDSGGSIKAAFQSGGQLYTTGVMQLVGQTVVGTAGAQFGYITVSINGTTLKIRVDNV